MNCNSIVVFLAFLRAGLFPDQDERGVINASLFCDLNWDEVYQLAQEQSVQGLILQGIDWFKVHDSRFTVPQVQLLQWIGEVQMIEQKNRASYYGKYPFIIRKAISAGRRLKDFLRHARIFPIASIRFLFGMSVTSFKAVAHGE